ncbi:hypothetical protein [Mycolicibacterium fallax]|uniref:hypothetical protein n=1 Tax=Mycolicibacterium fallax TaxID=1793 RepID=UPI001055EBA5|nr:hypothetical protein [Mycolicibacterium fallax]BBY99477.1 hypothetical protein MFAL_29440 [Mycolicibacterium fallax]
MTVNRRVFQELAAVCESAEALDRLIVYAAISLCEPGGLSTLLAAAYTGFGLKQAQDSIDSLVADGFVAPVTIGNFAFDTYIPTAA